MGWQFRVLSSIGTLNRFTIAPTDVIGSIAFDKENQWFATGGIARKIRIYCFESIIDQSSQDETNNENEEHKPRERLKYKRDKPHALSHSKAPLHAHDKSAQRVITTPARLSSVQWPPERSISIGCGDYDGVVTEWDIHSGISVVEKDGHGGRKIWSIDYAPNPPYVCASASDDGTVRLWDRGSENCVAVLPSPTASPVCCAQFSPLSSYIIALACSDCLVYIFDIRSASCPLLTLDHHRRPASYVRFLTGQKLVSASIDSTLKLWDVSGSELDASTIGLSATASSNHQRSYLERTFAAHRNVRNFVGLSVWEEGELLACGSETNEAFVYDCRRVSPVLRHNFRNLEPVQAKQATCPRNSTCSSIVSAVCWRQQQSSDCTLLAANSDGVIKILTGRRNVNSEA
eukprot:c21573_g1_i2 orf=1013-2221(+)